jgi:hypothetical protein
LGVKKRIAMACRTLDSPAAGNDLSRSLVALDQNSTIIAVIEMKQSSWLVGGVLPGIERQPRKKLEQRGRAGRGCLIEL